MNSLRIAGLGGLLLLAGIHVAAGERPDLSACKAVFTAPPQHVPTAKTPDAPLAGNGDIGITLGGTPDRLCFYIGKNDFWWAYPVYPGGIALPGTLTLETEALRDAEYYAEQLPGPAEIRGCFTRGGLEVRLNAWVPAMRNMVVIELSSNRPCTVKTRLRAGTGSPSVISGGSDEGVTWITRSFEEKTPLLEWPCHIALAMTPGDSVISLQPDSPRVIALFAYTNFDRNDWKEAARAEVRSFTPRQLETVRQEHRQWWDHFWNESWVSIGDPMLERYYYLSQYLFASSSRAGKFAPGIWGSYITRDSMAWGGDYHLNYNYQAPYWASYSSNHIDLTDNFDQPLLDYMDRGRVFARELLDCRGIYYPVGIGPWGLCTTRWPLTPEEMLARYATTDNRIDSGYKFLGQKINAVFSVGNMLMRFYSTYDEAYARRIYPYLTACADFWEDYLVFENGRYVIRDDHFNEVYPNLRNSGNYLPQWGDLNSTLSLGLVNMLFRGMLDVSDFLQMDTARREKWNHILAHMSAYPRGRTEDGRLSLSSMERGPGGREVRPRGLGRVSIHGLILPAGVCGPVTDSAFNSILLDDVAHWAERKQGPGDWGNTFGNGIETCFPGAVRVGYDATTILLELRERIEADVHPNGWIVQSGGGIETLSAVPMTINEMLLQSYEGVVRIFPNWTGTDAEFHDLRAYGAFLVSGSLSKGQIGPVKIHSEKGRPCMLENPWPGSDVRVVRNTGKEEFYAGHRFTIPTRAGEEFTMYRQ